MSGRKQILMLSVYAVCILGLAFVENETSIWLNASDAIIGVGIGMLLFMLLIRKRFDLNRAFFTLLGFEIIYGYARSLLFYDLLNAIALQMIPMYETYVKSYPQLHLNKEMLSNMQTIWLQYQAAIWTSTQILAAYFGLLLFNIGSPLKLAIRTIRLPFYLVYALLCALALLAIQPYRAIGINLIVPLSVVYLIQGTGILSHFWGNMFAKARMMRAFLIFAIILNYPILVLIAFIGVLDVWFDFRKLNIMEEKHEGNTT